MDHAWNGEIYSKIAQSQYIDRLKLVNRIDFSDIDSVIVIGCGGGKLLVEYGNIEEYEYAVEDEE